MKFIIFSDLHAHTHQSYSTPIGSGGNTRLMDTVNVLIYIRKKSQETGIRDIIFSGDLFEAKNRIPIVVLNTIYRELLLWKELGLNLIMIPGNHDLAVRTGDEHALEVLKEFKNLNIISKPGWMKWRIGKDQYVCLTLVPYREVFKPEWFDPMPISTETPKSLLRICIAHGIVQGAKATLNDSRILSDYTNDSLIPINWLDKYDLSVVGHVHLPQVLGAARNVLVPGQPWQQFPHEHNQDRGIWIVDIERQSDVQYELIKIPDVPEFVLGELNESGVINWINRLQDHSLEEITKRNIVYITPTSVKIPIAVIEKTKSLLSDYGAVYSEILPAKIECELQEPTVQVDLIKSPHETVKQVLESNQVNLQGFTPEELYELSEKFIDEALDISN